ncbi:hypothetical protein BJY24_002020 [Nocardia transvalensis]|uniref:Uncharacterized protein n=1 Tax=Nocardia transvalensis TaxID=37333 RepID=A0A7W9PCF6_9NOCA|nr:hypothetical protein [Nocardia transvalensis]MBB5913153.1 hypothetical protein [Nocardia transvalensis]
MSAGPCAVALEPETVGVARVFFDCLVLRVVVEPGDRPLPTDAVRVIRRLCTESDAATVIVTGTPLCGDPDGRFLAQLNPPDVLTYVADTLDVLSDFAEQLEERGERVHLMPFGWTVSWRADDERALYPLSGKRGCRSVVGNAFRR